LLGVKAADLSEVSDNKCKNVKFQEKNNRSKFTFSIVAIFLSVVSEKGMFLNQQELQLVFFQVEIFETLETIMLTLVSEEQAAVLFNLYQ
jgi:hypothetical protein